MRYPEHYQEIQQFLESTHNIHVTKLVIHETITDLIKGVEEMKMQVLWTPFHVKEWNIDNINYVSVLSTGLSTGTNELHIL